MIGPVLIHDGEPLDAALGRAAFGDINHPRVEIAFLTGNPFVDRIGDDVRDTPPVSGFGLGPKTDQLLAREHIPQAKIHPKLAIGPDFRTANHKRLGIDLTPGRKLREQAKRLPCLDKGALIDRTKQAGAFEIGGDDTGDVTAMTFRLRAAAKQRRHRNRQRLDLAADDIDAQLRPRGSTAKSGDRRNKAKKDQRRAPWGLPAGSGFHRQICSSH